MTDENMYWYACRRTGFRWQEGVRRRLELLLLACAAVAGLGMWSQAAAAGIGVMMAGFFGLDGLARLGHMAELTGPVGRMAALSRKLMMKSGAWRE